MLHKNHGDFGATRFLGRLQKAPSLVEGRFSACCTKIIMTFWLPKLANGAVNGVPSYWPADRPRGYVRWMSFGGESESVSLSFVSATLPCLGDSGDGFAARGDGTRAVADSLPVSCAPPTTQAQVTARLPKPQDWKPRRPKPRFQEPRQWVTTARAPNFQPQFWPTVQHVQHISRSQMRIAWPAPRHLRP